MFMRVTLCIILVFLVRLQGAAMASSQNANTPPSAPALAAPALAAPAAKDSEKAPPRVFDPTLAEDPMPIPEEGSNEIVRAKTSWVPSPSSTGTFVSDARWQFSFEPSTWVPLQGIDVAQSIIALPMAQPDAADGENPNRFGFAGRGEAWFDESFGVVLDGRIVQLDDADLGNGLGTRSFFVDAQTALRLVSDDTTEGDGMKLDFLAGTRVYAVEQGTLATSAQMESIAGALIGARASWRLFNAIDFVLQADIGGTNMDADPSWGATAQAGIALPELWRFSLNAGWRTLDETFLAPAGMQADGPESGVATGAMWLGLEKAF